MNGASTRRLPSFARGLARRSLWLCAASLAAALAGGGLQAAEPDPVETGRESFAQGASIPWYDRQQDAARPIRLGPDKELAEPVHRNSQWTAQPSSSPARTPRATGSGFSLFGAPLQVAGYAALAVGLALLVVWLAKAFLRHEAVETSAARVTAASTAVDRVEQLPVQLQAAEGDFLSEARRHYEAGRYGEAIVFLFSYQLLQLDQHQLIRLAKGKTNRQYLREALRAPALKAHLETTMAAFEDFFFGHHPLPRERFEACWQRLDEFHRQLEQVPA